MDIVYLLDKVEKNEAITQEHAAKLHELKLVEGRYLHLSITNSLAIDTGQEVSYTRSKGLSKEACKSLVVQMLSETGPYSNIWSTLTRCRVESACAFFCAISEHGASASLWPRLLES